jgi:hypothetical protein
MKIRLPHFFQKCFITVFCCTVVLSTARSQHFMIGSGSTRVEAGLNFGPTFFLGDLGGKVGKGATFIKDLNYELTKLMKGAFISVYPTQWMGFRLAGQYTYVEGVDSIISTHGVDELWRKQRNLDFKSNMWEVYGAMEIFPFEFFMRNNFDYNPRFRPYMFAGIGLFHFNPRGSLKDQNGNITWHELQPLHTEGQGFPEYPEKKNYKLTQINLPLGGGFKYEISPSMNVGLELLYRKTFTDYIDDVSTTYINHDYFYTNLSAADAVIADRISDKTIGIVTPGVGRYAEGVQRGTSYNNDAYFSFLLKFGFKIGGGDDTGYGGNGLGSGYNERAKSKARCPVRF